MKRAHLAERSDLDQRAQLASMQEQMAVLLSPNQDPDVAARIELDRLKKQLSALAERLLAVEGSLVPPQRVPALLEDMIGRKTGCLLYTSLWKYRRQQLFRAIHSRPLCGCRADLCPGLQQWRL